MSSRFQRDASRNALFSNYDAQTRSRPTPANKSSSSPAPPRSTNNSPYNYSSSQNDLTGSTPFAAYPASSSTQSLDNGFRPATPNSKGHYSASVMDSLESQNDEHVSEMTKKVRMLKDITLQIGDEIRDSTAFAEKMNDNFEKTRNRLRGTMNRMLRMAERTGIGWRVWLGFFVFVFLLFTYVWLF